MSKHDMMSKKLKSTMVAVLLASNSAAYTATIETPMEASEVGSGSWGEKAACIGCGIAGIVLIGSGAAGWALAAAAPHAAVGMVAACMVVCDSAYGDE
jgi:hypothetical protein